jgi:hypothetical protein
MTKTVYISIGNSDHILSQAQWSDFYFNMAEAIGDVAEKYHGEWTSDSTDRYMNACWCVEINVPDIPEARLKLVKVRERYGQDSVAWAEVGETEFL